VTQPFAVTEDFFEFVERAAHFGIAKAWPRPCILIEAALAYKKGDGNPAQTAFGFTTAPTPTLRAVNGTINEAARLQGMQMFRNFRVPEASVISKVFSADSRRGEARENLNWWKASDGTQLTDLPVLVRARRLGQSVHALVVPIPTPQ